MEINVGFALMLATLAGLSTGICSSIAYFISSLLAFVAGIMIYISLDELLPTAHKYGGEHLSLAGLLAGMLAWRSVYLRFEICRSSSHDERRRDF